MSNLKYALLALVLGSSFSMAGDCTDPVAPTLPDGGTASMEDMLAGQKAVKDFQAANLEYMSCVEKNIAVSARMAAINVSVHQGLSIGSNRTRVPRCCDPSHCAAKMVPSVSDLGSAIIRSI